MWTTLPTRAEVPAGKEVPTTSDAEDDVEKRGVAPGKPVGAFGTNAPREMPPGDSTNPPPGHEGEIHWISTPRVERKILSFKNLRLAWRTGSDRGGTVATEIGPGMCFGTGTEGGINPP